VGERGSYLRRALVLSGISIVWSGLVGSAAVYVALTSGSLSLLGFGADAVIDAVASVALVWRFGTEARPPHRAERVERIAERVVGGALIALAAYLVVASTRALVFGNHAETSVLGLGLLLASLIALPPLAVAKYRTARAVSSGALRADSILTAVAAVLGGISLASLGASEVLGWWWADAVAAVGVATIVAREGWQSITLAGRPQTVE
jgi:divalent metal cation (Fe/Co/Zn/Cd) transporter